MFIYHSIMFQPSDTATVDEATFNKIVERVNKQCDTMWPKSKTDTKKQTALRVMQACMEKIGHSTNDWYALITEVHVDETAGEAVRYYLPRDEPGEMARTLDEWLSAGRTKEELVLVLPIVEYHYSLPPDFGRPMYICGEPDAGSIH